MAKQLVIDSNCLQSDRLQDFLEASVHHTAILTDYAAMEAYQQNAVASIVERMSILARYPKQVIVLRGTQYVSGLNGRKAGLTRRMIYKEATAEFSQFCKAIQLSQQGDKWFQDQILERQREAVRQLDLVQEGSSDITDYYSIFESQFSAREKQDIRVGRPLQQKTLEKFVKLVAMLAGSLFETHPHTGKWPKPHEWPYTFIYRSSILHYLHFFQWIRNGSPKTLAPRRVRNDIVDLNFATYATFFGGIMTDDAKLERLYIDAYEYLHGLFIPVLTHKTN